LGHQSRFDLLLPILLSSFIFIAPFILSIVILRHRNNRVSFLIRRIILNKER